MEGGAIDGIARGGYCWCGGMSEGCPLAMAGDEEADAILGPVDARDDVLDRASVGGCWSTG